MFRVCRAIASSAVVLCLFAAQAAAQAANTGTIAGAVRDTTGGVLPGVTVEAASPALIEKVRTVVTDDQGQYKILDLRPGTYSVTFSLSGFSTVRRDGIELTTGFTANVNAEMRVGSLEETITVSGASPVVDTQNVRNQSVLSREVLEVVPASHSTQGYAALTLGVNILSTQQDVGGNRGESVTASQIHGNRSTDASRTLDGMGINTMLGTGGGVNYYYKINDIMAQEVTITTDGQSAEYETGGMVTNIVPKDGGNRFALYSNFSVLEQGPPEQQLHRRPAGTGPSHTAGGEAGLRRGRRHRRTHQARQAVVLRGQSRLGRPAGAGGAVLQPDEQHAVLHAGSRPAGIPRQLGARFERPPDLADQPQAEAQFFPVVAAELHVLAHGNGRGPQLRPRGIHRVPLRPDRHAAGHLELHADEPAAVRGRRGLSAPDDRQHEDPGYAARRHQRPRARVGHHLRGVDGDDHELDGIRRPEPEQPRQDAVRHVLRHRVPRGEGRHDDDVGRLQRLRDVRLPVQRTPSATRSPPPCGSTPFRTSARAGCG